MPRLITPTPSLHEAFLAAHREWGDGLHEDGFGTPEDDVISRYGFVAWVARVLEGSATSWWIVDDEHASDGEPSILGAVALRPTARSGDLITGHIGYGVTPSARGHGIARWALTTVLSEAVKRELPACVLVCLDDNIASIRTIEQCGGRLQSLTSDEDGVRRRIYRIDLAASVTGDGKYDADMRRTPH